MSLIKELFGRSPFGPLVEHTKKVHECVALLRPVMEAMIREDYAEVHALQDRMSKLEYEADVIKHEIRERLPRRYFLPVEREDLDKFLHTADKVADRAEDFAVIAMLRNTKIHPELVDEFLAFVDQIVVVADRFAEAAEQMMNLAEVSFGGAEAQDVVEMLTGIGEEEWKSDRMQRTLSRHIYQIEGELDAVTISFYEKIIRVLSSIANAAENTGEVLRSMIVKG